MFSTVNDLAQLLMLVFRSDEALDPKQKQVCPPHLQSAHFIAVNADGALYVYNGRMFFIPCFPPTHTIKTKHFWCALKCAYSTTQNNS